MSPSVAAGAVAAAAGSRRAETNVATRARLRLRAPDEAPRASLEVDAGKVGEAGPVLEQRIRSKVDQLRLREEILPGRDENDATIVVGVRSLPGDTIGYEVDVSVRHQGEVIEDTFRSEPCDLCTEGEVVEKAASMVAELIPDLRALTAASAESVSSEGEPDAAEASPSTEDGTESAATQTDLSTSGGPMDADRHAQGLGGMGKAGIGLLVAGAAGLGTGIPFVVINGKPRAGTTEQWNSDEFGYSLIGVGGALAITGAVLLILDRKRARKDRTAWVLPHAGARTVGLTVGGRF